MNEKDRALNIISTLSNIVQNSRQSIQDSLTCRVLANTVTYSNNIAGEIKSLLEEKERLIEKYRKKCSKLVATQHKSLSVTPKSDHADTMKTEIHTIKKFLT
jgi:hypothetical protein